MREIGSEFWIQHKPVSTDNTGCDAYLLSGRAALQFIIDDISRNRHIKKVLMPAYCCESMLLPFIRSGIDVQFYGVDCGSVDYPYDNDADLVFLIDFFGFVIQENAAIAQSEKQAGKIVIYDSTHKIDGNQDVEQWADYSYCSYRKWFYCNFAKATKHSGVFDCSDLKMPSETYLALRDAAAYKKTQYMAGKPVDKSVFLSDFRRAEQMLDVLDYRYSGFPVDFDIALICDKRRKNASYILNALKDTPGISLWRDTLGCKDTPIFVPILVDPHIRDDLWAHLISNQIYCPIHWPRSEHHIENIKLYDTEISLVCDQRYDIRDMERMVSAINVYMKG